MRLRNKKTGEIGNLKPYNNDERVCVWINDVSEPDYIYNSLAELNEDWEDYEEQCWYITSTGEVREGVLNADWRDERRIGNYFETKEEAEKVVEKLKALAEAKEDGLKIKGYYYNHEDLVILADIGKCNKLTLDTLFGKEID